MSVTIQEISGLSCGLTKAANLWNSCSLLSYLDYWSLTLYLRPLEFEYILKGLWLPSCWYTFEESTKGWVKSIVDFHIMENGTYTWWGLRDHDRNTGIDVFPLLPCYICICEKDFFFNQILFSLFPNNFKYLQVGLLCDIYLKVLW